MGSPRSVQRWPFLFVAVLALAPMQMAADAVAHELRAPSDPHLNSSHRDLKTIRAWNYVMAAADQVTNGNWVPQFDFPIQAVDTSRYPYEMIVTELRTGAWADQEHWSDGFLSADNIRTWQNSSPEGKMFLAYINPSELGGTKYFNGVPMSARPGWTDAAGQPTSRAPAWLLCPNPAYDRLNLVLFWHPEWKRHVFTELDHAITIGANGVHLDALSAVVDRLKADPGCARGLADGVDLEFEALRLVQELRAHVKSRDLTRSFYIMVSDGRTIYKKYPQLLDSIDGILGEMMFFRGWDHPGHMNGPEEEWLTNDSIRYFRALGASGVAAFTLEYINEPAKIQRLADIAATNCFIPAVTEQFILVVSRPQNQLYCDHASCTNNGVLLTARDLARCPKPSVSIESNAAIFSPGDTVRVRVSAANPPEGSALDLYVGALWPDGHTIAFLAGPNLFGGLGDYAAPASVAPMMTLDHGAALNTVVLEYTFPPSGIPAGSYTVFAALARRGSLSDNALHGGDLLGLDYRALVYAP